jgi:hypothetical protein
MSFSKFVASVRAYYKPRNEQDGVQIMNRLKELLESSDPGLLKKRPELPENQYPDTSTATNKPVGANYSLSKSTPE